MFFQYNLSKITFSDYNGFITLPKRKNVQDIDYHYNIIKLNSVNSNYYYPSKIKEIFPNYDPMLNDQNQVNQILKKYVYTRYKFILNNYICIHIRSGDLFNKNPNIFKYLYIIIY